MTKAFSSWTVLPHGQLTRLEDNVLTVTGTLRMPPMGDVERRMTVVRLQDGRVLVYSAIALDEAQMREIEQFGSLAYLIVPNDIHRLDAKVWKERYPQLKVIAPAATWRKVEEVVHVDATEEDFGDPTVRLFAIPGTGERELALSVEGGNGMTLILNDLIFDLANRPGVMGWIFEAIGMTGNAPHIPFPVKLREVKDESALRVQLEAWSRIPNLKRVVISHGKILEDAPAQVLGRIARDLAA